MYEKKKGFLTPDHSTIVWRYVDLEKFEDILNSRKLYFCRTDNMEDPMEGLFQLKDYERTKEMFKSMPLSKKFYFINCWHMSPSQSDGMWKLYTKNRLGVAIKSTVGKLIDSLQQSEETIHISIIKYRDFKNVTFKELVDDPENQVFPGFSSTNQFTYKRIEFSHEKELRLYFIDHPIPHSIKEGIPRDPLEFKKINVDLNKLVEEIVISPFASEEYSQKVSELISKEGLSFKSSRSDLYDIRS